VTGSAASPVVLVTGGASGIGWATAAAFAARDATVVLADVDLTAGAAAVRDLGRERCSFMQVDVTDAAKVEAMVHEVARIHGSLDIVHNNAGVASANVPLHEVTESEWDRVIGVNLRGAWNVLASALRVMRHQGHGAIVNTASVGSFSALAGRGPYCAAKAGLIALTKVAALENGGSGIRVNAVAPGTIATTMSAGVLGGLSDLGPEPMGRLGQPEEVAEAVVWLSSPAASYVNGTCLVVDGGWTVGVPPRSRIGA
jgi:NAD(P)-dependent dehydrogenase (short-subunit alcohol dehydrogenase family)